ncbi:MAG: hypothetical protein H6818_03390 [Phycisphaerales bacterium]|nr:hypothetical protein [Phycisphaerales bacterium]MCB9864299.1 hypothetical protein [Phycisphaerales bacterium]
MNARLNRLLLISCGLLLAASVATAQTPLGSEWTYQGVLKDGGEPVNGTMDFSFRLFDAESSGVQVAIEQFFEDVEVVNGVFTVEIDFGTAPFNGDQRWLEISVRDGVLADPSPHVSLSPRQPLTAAPYAHVAVNALSADVVPGIDGHSLDAADGAPIDALFVNNTGSVGIGTNTPTEKLTVSGGNLRADRGTAGGNYQSSLTLNGAQSLSINPFASVAFSNYDSSGMASDYVGARIRSYNNGGDAGDLRFSTKATANANPVDRMTITPSGDVGIGLATPTSRLHVGGTVTATAFVGDGSGLTGVGEGPWSELSGNVYYIGGNVGIGTASPTDEFHIVSSSPDVRLQATGGGGAGINFANTDQEYSLRMTNGEKFALLDVTAGNVGRLTIDQAGNVGIGTANPESRLSLSNGGSQVGMTQGQMGVNGLELTTRDASGGQPTRLWIEAQVDNPSIHFLSGARSAETAYASFVDNGNGGQLNLKDSAGVNRVNLQATAEGGQIRVYEPAGAERVRAYVNAADCGDIQTYGPNGNVNVWATNLAGSPDHGWFGVFDSAGTVQAGMYVESDGNGWMFTDILTINGGSDLAEPFDVVAEQGLQPGMVVAIDSERPGKLRLSTRAYDRTVAGIISGAGGVNPGLMMSQKGSIADGGHPIALTGRVYCWVDAEVGGAVQPGDMLTTSDTPGHAMRVTDHGRATGAILGKAMSSLESGRGLVLVLVSLQ